MTGLWGSLRSRTTMVLLAGMLVSNLIGVFIFSGERLSALRDVAGVTDAARIASAIRTIDTLPTDQRAAALCSQSGPGLTLALSDQPLAGSDAGSRRARIMARALKQADAGKPRARILVSDYSPSRDVFDAAIARCGGSPMQPMLGMMRAAGRDPEMSNRMARYMQRWRVGESVVASRQLHDGMWLNILAPAPQFASIWTSRFLPAFVVTVLVVTALSVWATQRMTRPLAMFAWAATRLGRDVNAPHLLEKGPREVVSAARAFNEMQRRLLHLIRSRTQMLAAISHDLRTPITRLRLRAEFVEDAGQRDKMLADLAQMEAMISATLAFARLDNVEEKPRLLDLGALIDVACDDAAELGGDVSFESTGKAEFEGRPVALRRVIDNLIGNAIKYGGRAVVRLKTLPDAHSIAIDDDGPGIPEADIERVFEPFHRLETSRNPQTGGVGLGLAVVRSIVEGHGGRVTLKNRETGGLRATVILPRQGRSSPQAGDVRHDTT